MSRTYARFYYQEFQRDYPTIYANDAAFATFMRLLSLAEAVWPATPGLPRSATPKGLDPLVSVGLVCIVGTTFTLKGFVAERTRRGSAARHAAAVRWHSSGNADA